MGELLGVYALVRRRWKTDPLRSLMRATWPSLTLQDSLVETGQLGRSNDGGAEAIADRWLRGIPNLKYAYICPILRVINQEYQCYRITA